MAGQSGDFTDFDIYSIKLSLQKDAQRSTKTACRRMSKSPRVTTTKKTSSSSSRRPLELDFETYEDETRKRPRREAPSQASPQTPTQVSFAELSTPIPASPRPVIDTASPKPSTNAPNYCLSESQIIDDSLPEDFGPDIPVAIAQSAATTPLRKAFLRPHFERALKRIDRATKRITAFYKMQEIPVEPIMQNYINTSRTIVNAFQESSVFFHQMNSAFLEPSTRRRFNRYMRMQVKAISAENPHLSAKGGASHIICEVVPGSEYGDKEPDPPVVAAAEEDASDDSSEMPILHLLDCPYHPESGGPLAGQKASRRSTGRVAISDPTNFILPTGTQVLLMYSTMPIQRELFQCDVSHVRLYPDWKILFYREGIRICCIPYHYVILNAINIALEGVH